MEIELKSGEKEDKIIFQLRNLTKKEMEAFKSVGIRFTQYKDWFGAEFELPRVKFDLYTKNFSEEELEQKINLGGQK